jgi:hypothetical protein
VLVFTALFTHVAAYCLPLNIVIFLRMWRRFRFWHYMRAIHGVTYGLSLAFLIPIFLFGSRYFRFVL